MTKSKEEIIKDIVIDCLSEKSFMSAPEIDYSKKSVELAKKLNVPKNYTMVNKVLKKLLAKGAISERKREGTAKTREFSMNSDYVETEEDEVEEEYECESPTVEEDEVEAEEPEELEEDPDEAEEPETTEEEEMQNAIDEVLAEAEEDEDEWQEEEEEDKEDVEDDLEEEDTEVDLKAEFEKETGKNAITTRGTERKEYIKWKDNR